MRQKHLLLMAGLVFLFESSIAQGGFSNYLQQTARINALAKAYPSLVKIKSIVSTAGGKDIWRISIGSDKKPAIAIVGGVEANQLLGTELAISFAENILKNSNTDSIKSLLEKTSFYIFPNMSPDAMDQYFAAIKYERMGNAKNTDDDRDGQTNEDAVEDLDANGKINWMRVESPIGDYKTHPDDPRVMVKADFSKGEKGKYLLLQEGIDNDNDGSFNEDGEGGVWFNKNFSFKHPSFAPGAGEFPVSEPETRSLLDNLYELFNIYAVVCYSSVNNLSTPISYNPTAASAPILAGWLEPDTKVNSAVSELYNKVTGLKDAPKSAVSAGDFQSWAYFHFGRLSFSTPGWWVPKSKPDTAKKEKPFTLEDPVANFLRWSSTDGISYFTDWKPFQHPDFPGQKVEIGGVDPFVLLNPPQKLIPELIIKNNQFLTRLAAMQPEIDIINLSSEKLGNGLSRVSLKVINKGALPSHSKLGERNYWVKRINVKVTTNSGQSVISGKKNQLLNSLEGYGSQALSWLIKGNGKVSIEVGCPTTGTKTIEVNL